VWAGARRSPKPRRYRERLNPSFALAVAFPFALSLTRAVPARAAVITSGTSS
jgi:hypothetical protein